MSETIRCPDCGHENPKDASACEACGFPLEREASQPPVAEEPPIILPPRPRRPPRGSPEALSLWLVFGTIMAIVVIYVAIKANVDRAQPAVQGASVPQQTTADSLRRVLETDSTDVGARVRLGDVLYDTGNWSEAIVQYRAAIRRDSSLANALVDLGVCYYNLGDAQEAERHFRLALQRDPHQSVALFNLGIVYERRGDARQALDFYHRTLQSDPPPEIRQAVIEAMSRVQEKAGVKAGPLGGG